MEETLRYLSRLANRRITADVYSKPSHMLETFMVACLCFVFVAVLMHLNAMTKKEKCKDSPRGKLSAIPSDLSLCTGMACADSGSDIRILTTLRRRNSSAKKYKRPTPEEFIRNNPDREDASSLCGEVMQGTSQTTTRKHLERAREHLELAKCSTAGGEEMRAVIDSLFELLQRVILSGGSEGRCLFRGDMAALAVEIADLSLDVQPAEVRRC